MTLCWWHRSPCLHPMWSGKYMKCCLTRQCVVVQQVVGAGMATFCAKCNTQLLDWSQRGVKCGISYQPPHCCHENTCQNCLNRVHDAHCLQLNTWFTCQHDHILTAERVIVRARHTSWSARSESRHERGDPEQNARGQAEDIKAGLGARGWLSVLQCSVSPHHPSRHQRLTYLCSFCW